MNFKREKDPQRQQVNLFMLACLLLVLLCTPLADLYAQVDKFQTQSGVPVFPVLSTAPATAVKGMMYLNTSDNKLYYYNGTIWVALGSSISIRPSAGGVGLSGTIYVGNTATGTYTYVPDDAASVAEGNSTFKWYIADDASGANKAAISGAASKTYDIGSLAGKYLAFGVTPISALPATGSEVLSSPYQFIYSGAVTASVSLTTDAALYAGEVLSPVPTFTPATLGTCNQTANATYTWYRNSSANKTGATTITSGTGTSPNYTVLTTDKNQYIGLEVRPDATCNAFTTAGIAWKQAVSLVPAIAAVNLSGTSSDGTTTYALSTSTITASAGTYSCTPVSLPAGTHTYRWYWSNDGGTTKTAVAANGTASAYTVNKADAAYPATGSVQLACGITPVASNGDAGTETISVWVSLPTPAYASATLSGLTSSKAQTGTTVTAQKGTYSFLPTNITANEGTPTYQWYQATAADGTGKTTISGQTASTYVVDKTLLGKFLAVGISPKTVSGEIGTEVLSAWAEVYNTAPVASAVTASGTFVAGNTLTASYNYTDAESEPAGSPIYQWYTATDASGTGAAAIAGATSSTYALITSNGAKYIRVGVTPVATSGIATGTEAYSTWTCVNYGSCDPSTVTFNYNGSSVTYGTILSSTGQCWLDRNLGASRVATSIKDEHAYGDYFQWCRAADGHQLSTSATYTGPVSNSTNSDGNAWFGRYVTSLSATANDWLSSPLDNGSLWYNGVVAGITNPCPPGWHVPAASEFIAEISAGMTNATHTYEALKFAYTGLRLPSDGTFAARAPFESPMYMFTWCSSVPGPGYAEMFAASSWMGTAYIDQGFRASGVAVRCLKNK